MADEPLQFAPRLWGFDSIVNEDGSLKAMLLRAVLLIPLMGLTIGCSPAVKRPQLVNPGPAGYQRYNATQRVDPYPLPDAGPEIVGGRPRGFQQPVPEVERSRQFWNQNHQQQYAYPTTTTP